MSARRILLWTTRALLAVLLLFVLAAAGVWWWAGQDGSLEWALRRASAGQPLRTEGVRGSLRAGWQIDRLVWEGEGLRVEAEGVRLDWEPLALIGKILRLERVAASRVRVVDSRKPGGEPMQLPQELRLPWRVQLDDLAVGTLAYEGATRLQARGLMGRYAFDGTQHEVHVDGLQLLDGSYSAQARLQAQAPFTLAAQLAGRVAAPLPGGGAPLPLQVRASARGPLERLAVEARLRALRSAGAETPAADVQAQVAPFADMPLPQAHASLRALDLAPLLPGAPRTLLAGTLDLRPAGPGAWRLQADLRNAAPGRWDAGRLPVESARASGEWRDGMALVQSLQAQLAGGRIEGSGAWEGAGWRFDGEVQGVDPARAHGQLAALPLSGPVRLTGRDGGIDFDLALRAGRAGRAARGDAVQAAARALELREAVAQGRYSGSTIALAPLRVRTGDGQLEGQLELDWSTWSGRGRLQVQAPALQARAEGTLAPSRGSGTLQLTAADFARTQQWLRRWPGVGPALAGLQLRGQGEARLAWQGGWRDPAVQGRVELTRVQWQPDAPAGAAQPLPWTVGRAELRLDGRLRDAALDLRAEAAAGQRQLQVQSAARLGGDLATGSWQGQLASLRVQAQDPALAAGPWQLQLRQPASWRFARDVFEFGAGEALLQAPALRGGAPASTATIGWSPVRRRGDQLATAGRIAGLPLAWVELVAGPQLAGSVLSGDMVFDAQWDAQLGADLRVAATLARVRGDVMVLAENAEGGSTRVSAGVRAARVELASRGEQLTLSLLWDSERAGRAQGELRTQLARTADGGWDWPEQAPLAGRLRAELPRIGVWSLLAPPGWRLRGSVSADIAVAGTRALPELSGPLRADRLALRSVVDGIELGRGRLRAMLAGQKLVVSEFTLQGARDQGTSGGTLHASGEGEWTPQGVRLRVEARADQLRASIRSDRQLAVSGPVSARVDREGIEVTGQLKVDRARIQIPDESAPALGDDVVVRNAPGLPATEAERRRKPEASDAGPALTLALGFDLGDDFRVSGRGVDTRLTGKVEVSAKGTATPQLTGIIRTAGGSFEAYGQKLRIDRGEVRFTGPVDNPALDILALREMLGQTQRVGVLVTGRAQAPHLELYSEPALSEAETLSWLVLGRSSAGGGAETALLQSAAAALLAGRSGGSSKGIAGWVGLDELSVRPDSAGGTAIVSVGKRFAENFYASYERSLSSATGTLFLFYDVSRRLTLRAEAGERAGLDLILTFFIDPEKK